MADQLTRQQEDAVSNRGGDLLVSAAAGSGKTKVLVERLMSYLVDPVKPENIDNFLIITYTKAAASELRAKIAKRLNEAIAQHPENRHLQRQMQRLYMTKISTVHSFCGDILKEYAYLMDCSGDFRVADENECIELQAAALDQILNEAYEQTDNPDFFAFVDSQGLGRDDRQIPQLVLSVYRRAKCHLDYEGWLDHCLGSIDMDGICDASQTVWGQYLMEDLKKYLSFQIQALLKCVTLVGKCDYGEKPAALLQETVAQLQYLADSNTWDEVWNRKSINYGTLSFSKKFPDMDLAEQVKAVRDGCKEGLKKRLRRFTDPSEQLVKDLRDTHGPMRGLIGLVRSFDKAYTGMKRSRHILDFGDLEHKMLDLLWGKSRSGITSVAKEIGGRYCQIMVDEYQDSNAVQDAIFRALTSQRNNCFMVGDVKQSIYQFRLADPEIFLEKYNRFAPVESAAQGQGRKVLLCNNFRSCDAVLEAVNDVFYDCMFEPVGGLRYTADEALVKGRDFGPIPDPEIELHGIAIQNDTYQEESAYVADRIKQMIGEGALIRDGNAYRPITPKDIVILLRSPGSVGWQFQDALLKRGIACDFDSGAELMEAEEVQFIKSMLQVVSNPLQDIPLIAVLSSRVFGFTADDLAGIRALQANVDFYTALCASNLDKTQKFLQILNKLRNHARMLPLSQLIDKIFLETDADVIFRAMPDGEDRLDNLRSFCGLVTSYSSISQGTLDGFLDYLEVIAQEGHQVQSGDVAKNAVTIMSVHKSKGLEFPVVFLSGLSKAFNMDSTREQVLCDSRLGLGLFCVDPVQRIRYPSLAKHAISAKMQAQSVSEELRVLYVAMTRPIDRLIMTYASSKLEKELQQMANKMDLCDPVLLSSEVGSAGEWVMLAALRHSEAAAFHRYSRKPDKIRILNHPWKIDIVEQPMEMQSISESEEQAEAVEVAQLEKMRFGLSYTYPHLAATQMPSKLTATQLKGRYKDQEVSEGTKRSYSHSFRKPSFAYTDMTGAQYGTAMHAIMENLRFEACTDRDGVIGELKRLRDFGYITEDVAKVADIDAIVSFFATPIGRRLISGEKCVREFKFSILDDAGKYVPEASGEDVLLQGVVDCALIAADGITVIDFKTDRINAEEITASTDGYARQVKAYAYALERIYGLPVKEAYLYYFRLGQFVSVAL